MPGPEPRDPRVRAVLDAVPPDADVLDVGCVQHDVGAAEGDGWLHGHLVERCDRVLGVDILTDAVADLQARGYEVEVADAERLALNRRFDAVVAGELLEHLSNPGRFLDGARRHLKLGGRLVLTTPNPWALCHVRRAVNGRVRVNPEHTCWYDAATLRQVLARHGFEAAIRPLPPASAGLTRLAWRAGFETVGATHLLAVAVR